MAIEELNKNMLEAAKLGDIEGVKKVLEQGADVNTRSKDGRTALIEAARWGRLTSTLLELLASHKADVNAVNEYGWTAMMIALNKGHLTFPLLKTFKKNGANIERDYEWLKKEGRLSPEVDAMFLEAMKEPEVKKDIEKLNWQLFKAAEKGKIQDVKNAIEQGADVNARNNKGHTVLEACFFEWPFSTDVARSIAALLSSGAMPDCTARDFITQLEDKSDINALERAAYALLLASFLYPEQNEALDGYIAKNRSRAANLLLPCITGANSSLQNGFLGILSSGRSSALSLSPETIPALVDILLDTLDSDPELAVEFIKKRVGKNLEAWAGDGIEGADKLVSRLVKRKT